MVRVVDLLAVEPTILDRGTTSPPPGALAVSCRDVSFAYGDDDDGDEQVVLHDLDLEIAAGRSVGVVGRTGSGKTTFSRLLLRLVEPTTGTVVARRRADRATSRWPSCAAASRSCPRRSSCSRARSATTSRCSTTTPTDDEVIDALRAPGCGALADGGIHRALGAGGAGLSAGESQLLALARVWLRQPDLVVLDEATARIDPVTEQRLEAAVAQLIEGRTTFIIAHKLSTLRMVDEVIVFDRGRIVEHDDREVLARSGSSRWRQLLELALEVDADDERRWSRHDAATDADRSATCRSGASPGASAQHEPRSFWLGWVGVRRVLLDPGAHRVPAGARLRGAVGRRHGGRLPLRRSPCRRRDGADGVDPHRRGHVDQGVGAHADAAARQPADGAGRQRGPGGRPAGRLGRRGADPLPRRHRGHRPARRRHGRRVGRARVHGRRRVPARRGRRRRRRRAADPAGRRRARRRRRSTGASRSTGPTTARPRRPSPAWSATSWRRPRRSRSTTRPTPCSPG